MGRSHPRETQMAPGNPEPSKITWCKALCPSSLLDRCCSMSRYLGGLSLCCPPREPNPPRIGRMDPTGFESASRVTGSFPIWSSYFCRIAHAFGKGNTEWAIGCVWRTLPVGTGRCLSSSRVARSAITVRVRRPPHGLLDLELVCYNDSVER